MLEHRRNDESEDFYSEADIEIDEADTATLSEKIQKLKKDLAACKKEKQEYLDGWQRARADLLNAKKRSQENTVQEQRRAENAFVEKLLPLCDSFEMAFRGDSWESADTSWKKGVEQVYAQLGSILNEYNIEKVGVAGELFSPEAHEAVSQTPVSTQKENDTVIEVLQSGYKSGEHLIRPAKVIVGVYEEGET